MKTTARDIARKLLGKETTLARISQGDFSKALLIQGLLGGYSEYKATQKKIGRLAPEDALHYLAAGSLQGPGADPATRLANPSWLEKHQLRIDPSYSRSRTGLGGVPTAAVPPLPRTGQLQLPADAADASQGVRQSASSSVATSSSSLSASRRRALLAQRAVRQPPPPRFTVRDAQQHLRAAQSQRAVFPQLEEKPMWVAKYLPLPDRRAQVMMPSMTLETPERALIGMKELEEYRQDVRDSALAVAVAAAEAGEQPALLASGASGAVRSPRQLGDGNANTTQEKKGKKYRHAIDAQTQ